MRLFPLLSLLLLTTSCIHMDPYTQPSLDVPDQWLKSDKQKDKKTYDCQWWKAYHDPILDDLIAKAIAENNTLKIAKANLEKARFNASAEFSNFLPTATGNADTSKSKKGISSNNKKITQHEGLLNANWQLDFFGLIRHQYLSSLAQVESQEFLYQDTLLTLIATVVSHYSDLRVNQWHVKITQENYEAQKSTYDLTKSRYDAGLVSELDVSQAQSLFLTTKSQIHTYQTNVTRAKNAITSLLGKHPGDLDSVLDSSAPWVMPENVLQHILLLPMDVIKNRPDLQAAERSIASIAELKQAAIASQYPQINIGGLFGYQHSNLFGSGKIWQLNAGLVFPLLNFGQIKDTIYSFNEEEKAALYTYKQLIFDALGDIENAFESFRNEQMTLTDLELAIKSLKETVHLSNERYQKGLASFNDVLLAEKDLFTAQGQRAISQGNIWKMYALIAKGLGIMPPILFEGDSTYP